MNSQDGTLTKNKHEVIPFISDRAKDLFATKYELESALKYYDDQIKLNDWWKPWYVQLAAGYQYKLQQIHRELINIYGQPKSSDTAKSRIADRTSDNGNRKSTFAP